MMNLASKGGGGSAAAATATKIRASILIGTRGPAVHHRSFSSSSSSSMLGTSTTIRRQHNPIHIINNHPSTTNNAYHHHHQNFINNNTNQKRYMGTWPKVRPVKVKVITMDVTGTIVSFLGTLEDHYVGAAEKSGISSKELHTLKYDDPNLISRAFNEAYHECSLSYPCFGGDTLSAKEWWKICVTRSFELAGVNMTSIQSDMVFQRIYSTFGSHAAYKSFEDAKPFLQWANRSGLVTGVLSNADERYGDSILPMLDITLDEVQFTCFSKDYMMEKPNTQFFMAAIDAATPWLQLHHEQQQQQQALLSNSTTTKDGNKILCHPSEVLHIGNDFVKDFEGARQAGMHCVLLDRYGEDDKAAEWRRRGAPVFKDLLDVVEFLGRAGCHLGF